MISYSDFLLSVFGPGKVQKLTLNLGLGCPNRDGTIGRGGCIYCNNSSFSPTLADAGADIETQIAAARGFFARKYPSMHYLAYFQTYTSTHTDPERLAAIYRRALACPDVCGLVVATRPDTMPQGLLDMLAEISRTLAPVIIEYGAESSHDVTLARINRCHLWADTVDAVTRTHKAGLPVGLHLIFGLPGETDEMMLSSVDRVSALPIDTIKFHQLQVIQGTPIAAEFLRNGGLDNPAEACRRLEITNWTAESYTDFCIRVLDQLRPDIAVDRFVSQAPPDMLLHPRWGLKNHVFTDRLMAKINKAHNPSASKTWHS